ncbi:MAG: HPF/RaiA family ribosome-associated protein [Nocardioides sp.]|jgi:ribosome-associated translation inhibitor RaiA
MATTMKVHLHTDHHVVVDAELGARIEANVGDRLARFADHLTRVDVHLTRRAAETGSGVRCSIEARPPGLRSIAVTHEAPDASAAIDGAVAKLLTTLGHAVERLEHRGARETIRGK